LSEVKEDIRFERDSEWLSIRYKELQTKHPNKYVAVLDEKVVGVGDDGEGVVQPMKPSAETQKLLHQSC